MLITKGLRKNILDYQIFTSYKIFLCQLHIQGHTPPNIYIYEFIDSTCVVKIYNVLFKIHEYSMTLARGTFYGS